MRPLTIWHLIFPTFNSICCNSINPVKCLLPSCWVSSSKLRAAHVGIWMRSFKMSPGNSKFLTWLCLMVSAVPKAVDLWTSSKSLKSAVIFSSAATKSICSLVTQQECFRLLKPGLGKELRGTCVCTRCVYVLQVCSLCYVDVEVIGKLYNMDFGISKMSFVFYLIKYGDLVKGKCQGSIKLPFLSPVCLSVDKWKKASAKITVNE